MSTLRVSKLVRDVTKASGRIQRMVLEDRGLTEQEAMQSGEIASIMDRLALIDSRAIVRSKTGDHEFDIEKVGVEPSKVLVLELRRRWTFARVMNWLIVGILIFGILFAWGVIAYQAGFDTAPNYDIQLPTLPEGDSR